jgi:hypothetical protein
MGREDESGRREVRKKAKKIDYDLSELITSKSRC